MKKHFKLKLLIYSFLFLLLTISFPQKTQANSTKNVTVKIATSAKKKTISICEGQKLRLVVKDGNKKIKWNKLSFKSDNSYYAKINKKGVITAKNRGKSKIIVSTKDNKKSCVINLKVKAPIRATSLKLSEREINIHKGDYYQLSATVFPYNTTDKTIEWKSSDPQIVSVSSYGKIRANNSGRATITAYNKSNGAYEYDYCYVNVKSSVNLSGSAGPHITYTLSGYEDELLLSFSGYGVMTNYTGNGNRPWDNYKDQVTRVVMDSGITSIGDYALAYMKNLTDVSISDTVQRIGDCAFTTNDSLSTVVIPASVTTIGHSAFWDSEGLTSITIPSTVEYVGEEVFSGCSNLTNASVYCDFNQLPGGMFRWCKNLLTVRIPAVSWINSGAFNNCPNLTTIYYGGSQEDWEHIYIDTYNESLRGKTPICNS